jgi:hypothetical protein
LAGIKQVDLLAALGLAQPNTAAQTTTRLNNQAQNLATRLSTQGIDPTPPPKQRSLLDKTLRTWNLPGAAIRSLVSEGVDDEYGVNLRRAFSKDRLYENPVDTLAILDKLGLAPQDTGTFGSKAARFGVGLVGDIATDPLAYLVGGITKPLQLLNAPVFGKTAANLTRQGAVQPFFRGLASGLRGTGNLGAALGDEGVLAARKAAVEGAKAPGGKSSLQDLLGLRAPRALTGQESAGLKLGEAARGNDLARGIIAGISQNSLVDPAYATLRRTLADKVGRGQRDVLGKLDDLSAKLTPEQQRLVTDLAESSGERSRFAFTDPERGIPMRLERVQPIRQTLPNMGRLVEEAPLEELPDNIYQAYKFVTDTLASYGDERVKRGLLGSIINNYFPHKLLPEAKEARGLSPNAGNFAGAAGLSQSSAKMREFRQPLKQLAEQANSPAFEREFVRPFAQEVTDSVRSIETFDFIREVNRQFAVSSDDLLKRFGFTPSASSNLPEVVGDYKLVDYGEFLNRGQKSKAYEALGKVYLPKTVADDVSRLYKAYNTEEGTKAFLQMWDKASNFWKPLVTTLNPGFHVTNFIGNMWNAFLGGMDNPVRLRDGYDVFLGRTGSVKAGAHTLKFETLTELANDLGVIKGGFFENETGRNVFRLAKEGLPKPVSENAIATAYNAAKGAGRSVGNFVEGVSRSALFTDRLIKNVAGYGDELTERALRELAQEAADHTNKYLFDYAHGLSQFENDVMRRIMPFYSWSRFNIPLQIAEVVNQPGKFLLYDKVKGNLASINPPDDSMPPWLSEALPTGFRSAEGAQVFYNPRMPLQDISRLAPGDTGRELRGMLNPLIKTPLELATNKSFFTGREIAEYSGQTVGFVGGTRIPIEAAHIASSVAGVFGKGPAVGRALAPGADSVDRLRVLRTFVPGLFTYNPENARRSAAFEEVQRLNNLIRKNEDESGEEIPTITTLRKLGLAR